MKTSIPRAGAEHNFPSYFFVVEEKLKKNKQT